MYLFHTCLLHKPCAVQRPGCRGLSSERVPVLSRETSNSPLCYVTKCDQYALRGHEAIDCHVRVAGWRRAKQGDKTE